MNFTLTHQKVKDYEINEDTMAIVPFINERGAVCSEVYEREAVILVEKKPLRLIKDNCLYYGGSYDGKKEAARINMGKMCFAPIMIDSKLDLYFFPIQSPRNDTCIWLAQPHIRRIDRTGHKRSSVIFFNGMDLSIANTRASLLGKLHRAAQYRSVLINRTNERERRREQVRNRDLVLT
ncbi:competence protein ComK [Fictibacillus phosphorivorans]|uniref:competence protein ComK n=1 Tax=Fictibacillus phosphorivorans TaxID=1221500 RepID=UPI00203C44F5|nr:competence protein ComK [Fictibacillus phosphorivorans]MCM3718076.1 competence protein ComK [Fictibacillus phosphorivorans]MCM3775703.1 competence protein ComK [Fictibacillus phosphorivorans]